MNKAAGDLLNRVHCQSGGGRPRRNRRSGSAFGTGGSSRLKLSYDYNIRNGVDCEQEASPAAREC
jgi:hypothetical protein